MSNDGKTLPIPRRLPTKPGEVASPKKGIDEIYDDVMENLGRQSKLLAVVQTNKAMSDSMSAANDDGGGRSSPVAELANLSSSLGVNIGDIMKDARTEAAQARAEVAEKQERIEQLRLEESRQSREEIVKLSEEIRETKEKKTSDIAETLGLGAMTDSVREAMQARIFGLGGKDDDDEKEKEPAMFSPGWFKKISEAKDGIGLMAKMFGFVSAEELDAVRRTSQSGPGLVSMEALQSGKVPFELALGLKSLELNAEVRKIEVEHEYELAKEKNKIFDKIGQTIAENVPDAIAALRDTAASFNKGAVSPGREQQQIEGEGPQPMDIVCPKCNEEFVVDAAKKRKSYMCPYCETRIGEEPPTPQVKEQPPIEVDHDDPEQISRTSLAGG